MFTTVDTEPKSLFEMDVYSGRGLGSTEAFLYRLAENHYGSDTELPNNGGGYLGARFWHELNSQLNYANGTASTYESRP